MVVGPGALVGGVGPGALVRGRSSGGVGPGASGGGASGGGVGRGALGRGGGFCIVGMADTTLVRDAGCSKRRRRGDIPAWGDSPRDGPPAIRRAESPANGSGPPNQWPAHRIRIARMPELELLELQELFERARLASPCQEVPFNTAHIPRRLPMPQSWPFSSSTWSSAPPKIERDP